MESTIKGFWSAVLRKEGQGGRFLLLAFALVLALLPSTAVAQDLQVDGKIAFGTSGVFVMNADGSGKTQLSSAQSGGVPAWSPDGSKVLFSSTQAGYTNDFGEPVADLYTLNADGTTLIRLTNTHDSEGSPAWSPDGTKIVFASSPHNAPLGFGESFEIWVMNADGTNPVRLTNNSVADSDPSWSPDGTRILFMSGQLSLSQQQPDTREVWVMNADGSGKTNLTNNAVADQQPAWSQDGTKIAYRASDGLFVMNADGSNKTRLTSTASDAYPAWSPDGTKVVFARGIEIHTINVNGLAETILDNNVASGASSSWGEGFRRIGSTTGSPITRLIQVKNTGAATLTISNITSSDGQFSAFPTSASVGVGGILGVTVTFTPNSAGTKYATLTFSSNDPQDPTARLTVNATSTGVAPPNNSPVVTVPGAQTVNAGQALTFNVSATDPDGWQFLTTSATGLPSGATFNGTTFSWTPSVAQSGTYTVTFTATDNGSPSKSDTKTVQITVYSPVINFTTGIGFANVNVGSFQPGTLSVFNTGTGPLVVSGITVGGPDADQFSVTPPTSFTVNPGTPQFVQVKFTPTSNGAKSATLSIAHNAPGSPGIVSLSGTGVSPTFEFPSGQSLDIGNVNVGGTGQFAFTVNNVGTGPLVISNITLGGPDAGQFSLQFSSVTVNPGTGYGNTVSFTPTSPGAKSATLTFTHNAAGSPTTVSLSGTGVGIPALSLSSPALSFGSVIIGANGQQTFTVSNTGNAALSVSGITVNGTDAAQFSVNPASFTVNPGDPAQTVTVTFTPTAPAGAKSASLSITHNAAGSPATVSLSGTAVAAPILSASPFSPTYIAANVGSSGTQAFKVSNTGSAALVVSGISAVGGDATQFSASPTTFTVNPGDPAQTVTVTFTPASSGWKTTSLNLTHNAAGSPAVVTASGAGLSPGDIITVAGNGNQGFSGDFGPGTDAGLNSPRGVALDGSGNLYIADQTNNRIRKVNPTTGIITTVAGNGTAGSSGDNGQATSAQLNNPQGVAVDTSGNLYIADGGTNRRIRKVNGVTGVITTVAGGIGGGGDFREMAGRPLPPAWGTLRLSLWMVQAISILRLMLRVAAAIVSVR